jgi:hypothetical protein
MLVDLDLTDLLEAFAPNPVINELTAKQRQLYYEPARFKCGLMGRRCGKSYTDAAALLGGQPGDVSLYATRKYIDAKAIMLPVFRDLNFRFDLGLRINLSDHTITEPNGAIIRLAGVKDEAAAEDLRGPRYRRVAVDECGTFHSELLQYLIEDVLQPALVDSGGDMVLTGTPGEDPDPKDYWFQLTGDPASGLVGKWPTTHGTIFDNPRTKVDPRIALADILRQNDWTEDHPTYRREYLAHWVPDVGSLVFEYLGDFATGPESGLTVLALDFGVVDHTSFTVLRQIERPHVWVMQSYSLPGLDILQIAEQVAGLRKRWHPNYIVADEGALGKGYALTLSRQYNIPVEPADKRHLRARIDMGRGMLAARQVHLTLEARELFDEWKKLPWNPLKTGFHDRYKADCSDGFLYGLSKIYALESYRPPQDTRSEAERLRDIHRANAERAASQASRLRRVW